MAGISPQGYKYNINPTAENPFWGADDISQYDINMTATVDDTTGTPAIDVNQEQTATSYTAKFSFTGLKGEKGETGETGATGAAGTNGVSPTVTSTGSTESGAAAGTITDVDGNTITVYNGAQGTTGAQGEAGQNVSKAGLVSNVSISNENGVYTFSQTKYDTTGETTETAEIGTIEIPDDSGIVEVKDTVVTNDTNGYDFHTFTETQNDGTENTVGTFYLAQKQLLTPTISGNVVSFPYINQSGTMGTETITLPESGGSSGGLETFTDLGTVPENTSLANIQAGDFIGLPDTDTDGNFSISSDSETTIVREFLSASGITFSTVGTTYDFRLYTPADYKQKMWLVKDIYIDSSDSSQNYVIVRFTEPFRLEAYYNNGFACGGIFTCNTDVYFYPASNRLTMDLTNEKMFTIYPFTSTMNLTGIAGDVPSVYTLGITPNTSEYLHFFRKSN